MAAAPTPELSDRELRLLRLRAQGLLPGSQAKSVAAAATRALAIQSQDVGVGRLGVRSRTVGLTSARAARARGACRSWLMRNTLFLFAEKELAWLRPVLFERPLIQAMRRLDQEGVPETEVERLLGVLADRVAQGPLPRQEARELLRAEGVDPGENNQRIYWTFHAAALRGVIAVRPPLEPKQSFAPGPPSEELPREQALGRLARRFLKSHGPATPDDLAYWAKTTKGNARLGWENAGRTVEVMTEQGPMTALPGTLDPPQTDGPVVHLLGSLDHWLLSWADRSVAVPAERMDLWSLGGRAYAYADGRAFGTWRLAPSERGASPGSELTVVVEPFGGRLPRGLREGVDRETSDLGRFFESEAQLVIEPRD